MTTERGCENGLEGPTSLAVNVLWRSAVLAEDGQIGSVRFSARALRDA